MKFMDALPYIIIILGVAILIIGTFSLARHMTESIEAKNTLSIMIFYFNDMAQNNDYYHLCTTDECRIYFTNKIVADRVALRDMGLG